MWTLTDKQLAMIKRAAALLPSHAQPALLRSVANVLAGVEHAPRDRDVMAVFCASSWPNAASRSASCCRGTSGTTCHDRSANTWQSWHKRSDHRRRANDHHTGRNSRPGLSIEMMLSMFDPVEHDGLLRQPCALLGASGFLRPADATGLASGAR